jgi:ABC-2 type transport system permease protein
MNALLRCLSAETLKLRRTLALALTVLAPFVIALLVFAMYAQHSEYYINSGGINPWKQLCDMSLVYWNLLMLPLFITLETGLLTNLEHSRKNWKLIYTLPNPRWAVYAAKQIVAMVLFAISLAFMVVFIVILGNVLQAFLPKFGFDTPIPWGDLLSIAAVSYLASWFLISFHMWVSTRSNSFVLSMAVGITATILGVFLFGEDIAQFYPWTIPGVVAMNGTKSLSIWLPLAIGNLGGIALAVWGGWNVIRRDVE